MKYGWPNNHVGVIEKCQWFLKNVEQATWHAIYFCRPAHDGRENSLCAPLRGARRLSRGSGDKSMHALDCFAVFRPSAYTKTSLSTDP
jgi:hypothetical protein